MLIEHVQDRLRRPDAMQTQDLVALLSAGSKNSAEDRLLQLERAIMSGSAIKPDLPDVTRPRQELLEQVELKMAIGDELRMQTEPNPYEVAVCGQFDIPFKRLRGRRNRQGRYALAIAGRNRSRAVGLEVEIRQYRTSGGQGKEGSG